MTRMPFAFLLALAVPCVATAQPVENDLHCFNIKDSAPRAKYQVTVSTAAGTQTCTVRTPAKLGCVPAAVTGITPPTPGDGPDGSATGAFLCYRAKCAPAGTSVNTQDRFGTRVIRFRASRFVCAPANLDAPPPGVTTTTTTLPATNECRFQDGECRGTCTGGRRCGAAVGTDLCECRDVACGDADAPACDGACSDPDEACIFDLNGCSCVNIP
jgi:hypothetical protein